MKDAHMNVPEIASIEAIYCGQPGLGFSPPYPGVMALVTLKYKNPPKFEVSTIAPSQ